MEAEDSDGDTALHLVLLQMRKGREAASAMTFMLNVLFRVQPKNIDKAPAINKARDCLSLADETAGISFRF